MKKLAILLITAISVAGAIQAQSKSTPTLIETLQWMQNTLAPKVFLLSEGNGYSFHSAIPGQSHIEIITSFTFEGCKVVVARTMEDRGGILHGPNGASDPFVSKYLDTFSLCDVDPASIKIEDDDDTLNRDLDGKVVIFSTTNAKKTIHFQSFSAMSDNPKYPYGSEVQTFPEWSSEEYLRFSSTEYAQRFLKALKHAVLLSGGKPSAF